MTCWSNLVFPVVQTASYLNIPAFAGVYPSALVLYNSFTSVLMQQRKGRHPSARKNPEIPQSIKANVLVGKKNTILNIKAIFQFKHITVTNYKSTMSFRLKSQFKSCIHSVALFRFFPLQNENKSWKLLLHLKLKKKQQMLIHFRTFQLPLKQSTLLFLQFRLKVKLLHWRLEGSGSKLQGEILWACAGGVGAQTSAAAAGWGRHSAAVLAADRSSGTEKNWSTWEDSDGGEEAEGQPQTVAEW